jgi:hypothetical protein
MIKKYIQFINENRDLPELNSFDELDEILNHNVSFDYNSRPLTDNEKKLLDEYCKRFESKFLLTHQQINEVLLDLDLIDNLSFEIIDILIQLVNGERVNSTDFNYRDEIRDDVRGLIAMKRWYNLLYNNFIGETIRPAHSIIIQKTPKTPFDNEKVYEYLEMVKETFEEMCECNVILDKGGKYSMQLRIEYPETTIE